MTKHICDRCGKEIRVNKYGDTPCYVFLKSIIQSSDFELCADCGEQVLALLRTKPDDIPKEAVHSETLLNKIHDLLFTKRRISYWIHH